MDDNKISRKFKSVVASAIDAANKTVTLKNSQLPYDYLFIAMGMHKVTPKGVEHTLSICGAPEQSVAIADALEKLIATGKGKIAVGFNALRQRIMLDKIRVNNQPPAGQSNIIRRNGGKDLPG